MERQISNSVNANDYEVLIRKRGEGKYASYCPQLNYMITGEEHEEVYGLMVEKINSHIESLNSSN
ncbi:MAG: hypothetical protein CVV25_08640 [Ignavibacteriae bacterium HGW-Ignavibacteriae-4]|jgi:hypothetical protein|nr:MAG: hypothetical protein CVV25_08640 [Ignavibacteriae bacterium HGW-Ignavibacteriae-4]